MPQKSATYLAISFGRLVVGQTTRDDRVDYSQPGFTKARLRSALFSCRLWSSWPPHRQYAGSFQLSSRPGRSYRSWPCNGPHNCGCLPRVRPALRGRGSRRCAGAACAFRAPRIPARCGRNAQLLCSLGCHETVVHFLQSSTVARSPRVGTWLGSEREGCAAQQADQPDALLRVTPLACASVAPRLARGLSATLDRLWER
jgi:hypothetical protein